MVSKTFSKKTALSLLAVPFLLAGCGEGYELVGTQTMFPYGNQRTAGTGYAYVLAKMLPEKDVNLQSVKRDWKPEVMEMLPKEEDDLLELPPVEPKEEPVAAVEPPPEPETKAADELFLEDGKK